MFPLTKRILPALIATMFTGSFCMADELGDYLRQLGLRRLLAEHVYQLRAAEIDVEQKKALTEQLAEIYMELLLEPGSDDSLGSIEQASRRLISEAGSADVNSLRLTLIQSAYRRATAAAEQHRAGTTDQPTGEIVTMFRGIVLELDELIDQMRRALEVMEKDLGRERGLDANILVDRIAREQGSYDRARFFRAWCDYYIGWLESDPVSIESAQRRFATLLEVSVDFPTASRASRDLLENEYYASSVLGMALAVALEDGAGSEALQWLDLLDEPTTHEAIRGQVPAWKIVVLVQVGKHAAALEQLRELVDSRQDVPLLWLRLAAEVALSSDSARATDIVELAVTELASQGALDQVVQLASRHGVQQLGATGFARRYVRGIDAYERAQQIIESGDGDLTQARNLLGTAAESLAKAVEEPDADDFSRILPSCNAMIGWCHFQRAEFRSAMEYFLEASMSRDFKSVEDTLWMALVCLDKLAMETGQDELEQIRIQQVELIDRFLQEYPASGRVPELLVRRTSISPDTTLEDAQQLLRIPVDSEAHDNAIRQALRILYTIHRNGSPQERIEASQRYVEVFRSWLDESAGFDPADAILYRQGIEVSLSSQGSDIQLASRLLQLLETAVEAGRLELDEVELLYRRLQLALNQQQLSRVPILLDAIELADPAGSWSAAAHRLCYQLASTCWLMDPSQQDPDSRRACQALLTRSGRAILSGQDDLVSALSGPYLFNCAMVLTEAELELVLATGDLTLAADTADLVDVLLQQRPNDSKLIRRQAVLAGLLDRPDVALAAWRRLVAGSPSGSDEFFEAKTNLLELLADLDPGRARRVLDQHLQFHPDYAPEPWSKRLRDLDGRLPAAGTQAPEVAP